MDQDKRRAAQAVATDVDQEVKLLVEKTGMDAGEARKLLQDAGTFEEAMRRAGEQKLAK